MNFISFEFVAFLIVTVVLYYLVPKKTQWILLLLANIAFYCFGGFRTVGYLVFTTLTTWGAGLLLERMNAQKKTIDKTDKAALEKNKKERKAVVAVTLVLNFGMLFMLKYLGFTVETVFNLVGLFGVRANITVPDFVLPLGVSFYIFQSTGYVIDMYRGKYPAQHNIAKFSLFTSFFPQMVEGPISRYDRLGTQLTEYHPFNTDNIRDGILIIMWGYFKKMVIADRAAVVVSSFFAEYWTHSGSVIAFSILMYCINLYCDFSGGIDITVGAARLLGIELEENFRRPLFSRSLTDYWRRWHITLGGWMRDYVFYPLSLSKPFGRLGKWAREKLGGKAGKIFATSAATFIVYLIIGIWHGANFRYIAFGFYNGIIITSSLLLAGPYNTLKTKLKINEDCRLWHFFQTIRTCFIVFIGRYITKSPRLLTAIWLIINTFMPSTFAPGNLFDGTLLTFGLTLTDLIIVFACTVFMHAVEFYEEKRGSVIEALSNKNGFVQWGAMTVLMLLIVFFGIMRGGYISSEFIYKAF